MVICYGSPSNLFFLNFLFIKKFFFKFLKFILRGREYEQGRSREREEERIPSRLHTVRLEPDEGLELTNCEIMT